MIVNKPQFDLNAIEPCQAYQLILKNYKRYVVTNTPCIILNVEPLSVGLMYFDKESNEIRKETISISDVVSELTVLKPLIIKNQEEV